ncbi:signal peptidase II [Phenylobacterium immobile]|uniref:signal peptidase II n=1 Tax=Phenylobacterium immobile TaxID=21 RepID=UPI000B866B92|nr:signal peptidase II [Phenylobacterium immobile]
MIVLDQASKAWILYGLDLPDLGSVALFWPLRLTMVWNQGVSFGLLQAGHDAVRWALFAFSLGVAGVLAAWALKATRWLTTVGLGLVIGGAVGNAIDRARFAAVVDFIDVQQIGFFPWIFNIADSAITVGVCFLLWDSLRKDKPQA